MKVLLIDNYDSFVYNLLHLVSSIPNVDVTILRNDDSRLLPEIESQRYDAVIIGPGPGSPEDDHYFGKCRQIILEYGAAGLPILGVCLGFQGIAHAFGASLKRASLPVHGKMSRLNVMKDDTLFANIDGPIDVMRYHSIMIDTDKNVPEDIIFTAQVVKESESVRVNGSEIMALEHRKYPIYGVQYHPESFATDYGKEIIENFLRIIA